jgi:hypothetical protein
MLSSDPATAKQARGENRAHILGVNCFRADPAKRFNTYDSTWNGEHDSLLYRQLRVTKRGLYRHGLVYRPEGGNDAFAGRKRVLRIL